VVKTGIGQDSHRFTGPASAKPLRLAGIEVAGSPGLEGNSDADVILHAVTNAISGITGVTIIGGISDELCLGQGITDSRVYLKRALEDLGEYRLTHLSITVEALRPKLSGHTLPMRRSLAALCGLSENDVTITATTGEQLTGFGRGEGMQAFAVATAVHRALLKKISD
jgi:2-C-methyl-D-erythritol 2,4-cyclodiphosphate synthase